MFTVDIENTVMNKILTDGKDGPAAAKEWLKTNPKELAPWLDGVTTFDGKPDSTRSRRASAYNSERAPTPSRPREEAAPRQTRSARRWEGRLLESWFIEHKLPLGRLGQDRHHLAAGQRRRVFRRGDGRDRFPGRRLHRAILLHVPFLIFVLAVAALAYWLHRSWRLAVFVVVAFLLIANLGYWQATVETISLVGFSTLTSVVIGVPVGIAAAHRPWLYACLRPLLDLMQTLPTFVYLIPTLVLFHLGAAPGLISTVIFAIAAPIRLTHLGIASVPLPLKEAGAAFGATKRQLLWKVELPYAMPTIMAGVTQCIMLSLSMVVIAALVGAAGLGTPVVRALGTVNIPMGIEAGVSIVLLAIVLDRVFRNPERKGERLRCPLSSSSMSTSFSAIGKAKRWR